MAAALGEAGCAIVERLVPPAVLDHVRTELAPYLAATPCGPDDFSGRRTRRTGGRVRDGLNLTYALSWLRQEENQYLTVPAEVARQLPVPLLRLMGYARGAYALGYVDDLRDPLEVLLGRPVPGEAAGLGNLDAALDRLRQQTP